VASTVITAPSDALVKQAIHHRTLRWIMLGIVALAAFLVAVVGQPTTQATGPAGPHNGLVGVSQPGPLGPNG
jgi:hypothetical protein